MNAKKQQLITKGRAVVATIRRLEEKQKNGTLDASDTAALKAAEQEATEVHQGFVKLRADEEIIEQAKQLSRTLDGSADTEHLGAAAKGRQWATSVAEKMGATATATGVKALTTGSIDVAAVVAPGVVPKADNPTRLIDLLIDREPLAGNEYSFLQQTVRTNNAAPVADFGTKPTSIYTFAEKEDRARVIAHLSEPIPERFFDDHTGLISVLEAEMYRGVLDSLEAEAVAGPGTGEHLTGILNTSGIVNVAFATDVFTTLRKARTGFQAREEVPTAWVFNPSDEEAFDLAQDAEDRYLGELPNVFGKLDRIVSTSVPAGTAILADWAQARVFVRENTKLDADRSGTNFTKNQVVLRAEGRFGFGLLRPNAFSIVDLTA